MSFHDNVWVDFECCICNKKNIDKAKSKSGSCHKNRVVKITDCFLIYLIFIPDAFILDNICATIVLNCCHEDRGQLFPLPKHDQFEVAPC